MKKVISASRRTDLVSFFPGWLAACLEQGQAVVRGPRRTYQVGLLPSEVHTIVFWSKNFANLLAGTARLKKQILRYDQIYLHFTVTGLGGGPLEPAIPAASKALAQVEPLVRLAGDPRRVSLRFDPVVFWRENGRVLTNLGFFPALAERARSAGIKDLRMSFVQWYAKARRRAAARGIDFVDPPEEEKKKYARELTSIASDLGLTLYACSQSFLSSVEGIRPSSCIDGRLLRELHPGREPASVARDRTQRPDCGCTESVDIGSYTQACPGACVYCYANPKL